MAGAVFVTTLLFMALGLFLLEWCQFLIPFRHVLFIKYGAVLASFGAALFVNLWAAVYLIGRVLFLKDTGRKLAHLEKQLRSGGALADELSRRLEDE
jgi:hypothetical protein